MMALMMFWTGCVTTPKTVETPAPVKEYVKVKYPVPSQRLMDFIKTGPQDVKRDFANYMIEVKGLGNLVGK
jgi:hypothetical protein